MYSLPAATLRPPFTLLADDIEEPEIVRLVGCDHTEVNVAARTLGGWDKGVTKSLPLDNQKNILPTTPLRNMAGHP